MRRAISCTTRGRSPSWSSDGWACAGAGRCRSAKSTSRWAAVIATCGADRRETRWVWAASFARSLRPSASSPPRSSTIRGTKARRWTRRRSSRRTARRPSRRRFSIRPKKPGTASSNPPWRRASPRATTCSTRCSRRPRCAASRVRRSLRRDRHAAKDEKPASCNGRGRNPEVARATGNQTHRRGNGALRHPGGARVRGNGGDAPVAREAARERPRPVAGALGDRLVRGAPAGRDGGRAAARDAPADGRVGGGIRELGRLRHGLFPPLRPDAARVERAPKWSASPREFVRRGGFVLMACLAAHDKAAPDGRFLPFLKLIEKGAGDDRNFVKKGVSWALRGIGRRSRALHAAALPVAKRLAASEKAAARWVGKDALRDLTNPKVLARLAGS